MDMTLTEKLLPAPLVCKGFVLGTHDCNYEKYLLELVNASTFFKEKSGGEVYTSPTDESHGEYDCNSTAYCVDFKLIASETALRARNLFSGSVYAIGIGATAYGSPKIVSDDPKYKPIPATRIHAALRPLSLENLKQIRKTKDKGQGINSDIRAFLETLETDKNILLFFPYKFTTKREVDFDTETAEIINALNSDFSESFRYRQEVAPQFDTYFMFLYERCFVIAELNNGCLKFIEAVQEKSCPTYLKFKDYSSWV